MALWYILCIYNAFSRLRDGGHTRRVGKLASTQQATADCLLGKSQIMSGRFRRYGRIYNSHDSFRARPEYFWTYWRTMGASLASQQVGAITADQTQAGHSCLDYSPALLLYGVSVVYWQRFWRLFTRHFHWAAFALWRYQQSPMSPAPANGWATLKAAGGTLLHGTSMSPLHLRNSLGMYGADVM